ncbi:calcium-binding and coiled-coil domain-containing protein 1 [Phlebotomus argentipes]|uniref:calcium-binding and coiled-coil domain-containing protein 1 n=1 Tax=Phlebotomus argentipes TaxID=94469 RepID=UPI0028935293|nr:calcium-binding and coiled-coil domain-containing protein 1 [Phlebotomus argentipes]
MSSGMRSLSRKRVNNFFFWILAKMFGCDGKAKKTPLPRIVAPSNVPVSRVVLHKVHSKPELGKFIYSHKWTDLEESLKLRNFHVEDVAVEVSRQQDDMRKSAQKQRNLNSARMGKIYQDQKTTRSKCLTLNDFLRVCQERESVAERLESEEMRKQEKYAQEIESLTAKIAEMRAFKGDLEGKVQELQPFEKAVELAAEDSTQFSSPDDLMSICDAFFHAQREISMIEKEKLREIDNLKRNLVRITGDSVATILGYINRLSELEQNCLRLKQNSLRWERVLKTTKDFIAEENFEAQRIQESIKHLHKLLFARHGRQHFRDKVSSLEKQLEEIRQEVKILKLIVQTSHEHIEKGQKSLAGELGTSTALALLKIGKISHHK